MLGIRGRDRDRQAERQRDRERELLTFPLVRQRQFGHEKIVGFIEDVEAVAVI